MLIKRKERDNNEKLRHVCFCIIFFILIFICFNLVAEIKTGVIPVYSADNESWDFPRDIPWEIPLDPGFTPIMSFEFYPDFLSRFFGMNRFMQQQQQRTDQVLDWLGANFGTSSIPYNYRIRYPQVSISNGFPFPISSPYQIQESFFQIPGSEFLYEHPLGSGYLTSSRDLPISLPIGGARSSWMPGRSGTGGGSTGGSILPASLFPGIATYAMPVYGQYMGFSFNNTGSGWH